VPAPAATAAVWAVEEDVVRAQELGAADDLDAQAQDGAGVDGVGVWVARTKGGEGCAGAVEALLVVGELGVGAGEEGFVLTRFRCACGEEGAGGGGGEDGGGLDAEERFEGVRCGGG